MEKEIDDAYKRGAEDAWEAAKKIVMAESDGGLSLTELHGIFGFSGYRTVFKNTTPLEAIEKIRRNEFQVGDEVKDKFGFHAVVTRTKKDDDESQMSLVFRDGSAGPREKDGWTKTGRHFPQIAEVLGMMDEAMKGE